MAIPLSKYIDVLLEMTEKPDADLKVIVSKFVALLKRHHRLHDINLIVKEIERRYSEGKGISDKVLIEYAGEHDPQEQISQVIAKITGSDKLVVSSKRNPALIGGARVIFEGKLVDASIAGKLQRFSETLHA